MKSEIDLLANDWHFLRNLRCSFSYSVINFQSNSRQRVSPFTFQWNSKHKHLNFARMCVCDYEIEYFHNQLSVVNAHSNGNFNSMILNWYTLCIPLHIHWTRQKVGKFNLKKCALKTNDRRRNVSSQRTRSQVS